MKFFLGCEIGRYRSFNSVATLLILDKASIRKEAIVKSAAIFQSVHERKGRSFDWPKDYRAKFQLIPNKIIHVYSVAGEDSRVDEV